MNPSFPARVAGLVAIIAFGLVAMAVAPPVATAGVVQECKSDGWDDTVNSPGSSYYDKSVDDANGADDLAACDSFSAVDFDVRPASGVSDFTIGIGPPPVDEATASDGAAGIGEYDDGTAVAVGVYPCQSPLDGCSSCKPQRRPAAPCEPRVL